MTWATWIIALFCSAAVGTRIGRLTVRPPSLARTAVMIAAIGVAAAATVRTPTLEVVIGPVGSTAPQLVFIALWVVVAAATAIIAFAAWPAVDRQTVAVLTIAVPIVVLVDIVLIAVTRQAAFGSVFVIVAGLFSLAVGVRYIAWHSLGRAIALYLLGLAVAMVVLVIDPAHPDPGASWWAIAIVLMSLGCSSVMIESWFLARFDLRMSGPLSEMLLTAHPELAAADYKSATPVLRADDRVSQILDGLYLHAGAGVIIVELDDVDALSPHDRAVLVAAWLHDSEVTPIDPDLLSTPDALSDRTWVRMVAREFNKTQR
ncbi:hypothetical protein [Gordonia malaquae]|jgi:hypothetical protein|uniref:hypothetical protein n=1 Tax=Gordonia malaquae TaxID=410332 RepID=UPI003019B863